jgi:S-DNA-T family DNA segregation ATPase FtsK/SpoIIIE
MPDSTAQRVLEVRAALAQALGAAAAALEDARRRQAAAVDRRDRLVAAAEQHRARLATERDRRLHEIEQQRQERFGALADDAAQAAARSAPGAAGTPWAHWRPTPGGPGDPAPELRVGRLPLAGLAYRGEVPALVPFLDRGHGVVRGDDRLGDEVVAGLLLRALGTARPGAIRLTGYDPENLGGGLAGFAPLAPAGVLTFVGPGGLGDLLDELVDHVRRINETVLAGGPSPGGWRCCSAAAGRTSCPGTSSASSTGCCAPARPAASTWSSAGCRWPAGRASRSCRRPRATRPGSAAPAT